MSGNIRPTLAIMAAGLGQRYGGPKQIEPINEYILLEYSIYDALREGFGKVVILIREDFENGFRRYKDRIIEGAKNFNAAVECAYQPSLDEIKQEYPFRKKMWGTGYAALCFKDAIQEPAAFINADNFYGREPFRLIYNFFNGEDYNQEGNVYALVGYRLKNVVHSQKPVAEAICGISDGFLDSIVERTEIMREEDTFVYHENTIPHPINPDAIVSTTFWAFNPTMFSHLENGFNEFLTDVQNTNNATREFYLPNFVDNLIVEGKIKVRLLPTEERCFGMTYETQRAMIEAEIQKLVDRRKYPNKLWDKN